MKKAQSGMNAAMLVAILAALIVIYIIFLPSDDRLDLVGENDTLGTSSSSDEEVLLEDNEIIMEVMGDNEIDHIVFFIKNTIFYIYRVFFSDYRCFCTCIQIDRRQVMINFKLSDPDNTGDMLISFDAKKSKGNLILIMNNYEIYNNEITKVNIDPIKVPKDYLAKSNDLRVEVSGVGIAFWSTNEYLLENFKVTADVTDTSTQEGEISFIVPSSESRNIEKAEIRFVPECQPNKVGLLDILINNHVIYSSVPDCGIPRPLDFSPVHIITGENKLVFRTEKGRYLIDQIKITTELKETPSYTYFFEIDNDQLEDIEEDRKKVNLTFYFVDDKEDKEAEIIINGRKTFMTLHNDLEWSMNIDRFVEEGSNSLKIIPEEKLEIRKLEVRLEEED
jgi:hypothetical protein